MSSVPRPSADSNSSPDSNTLRTCTACGETKPLDAFSVYSRNRRPYSRCKPCQARATAASRAKVDPEEASAKRKASYAENRDRRLEQARNYRERKRAENPKASGPPASDTKQCKKCGEAKPITEFYVYDKEKGHRLSTCKPCHIKQTSARSKELYQENPGFFRQKTRDYVAANRDEVNRKQRERRQANIESARQKDREWWARPENRSRKAEYRRTKSRERKVYNAEYRKKNKNKILKYDQIYRQSKPWIYRKASKKWASSHPELARACRTRARHKRRAILANVEGTYTDAEWEAIKARHDYTCPMCGYREPFVKLTVDHIIPISKGGTNWASNLQPLCGWCNSVKKDRLIDVRGYLRRRPEPRRKPRRQLAR
jgi:5-methylcytosine-specific restriction endonuclease McrA